MIVTHAIQAKLKLKAEQLHKEAMEKKKAAEAAKATEDKTEKSLVCCHAAFSSISHLKRVA